MLSFKKGSKKRSSDKFDLVEDKPVTKKNKHVVIDDDDEEFGERPGGLPQTEEIPGSLPKTNVADTTHYPCEGCQKHLFREVDAKLQARTLPAKTVGVLKLLPHFTADELVDTIVDMYSPSTVAPITSPARVVIADDDDKWRVLKFPDINFFAGTNFEKTIQPWMIPKMPVLCHITNGIIGCALCKLQSVASNSPVSFWSVRCVFFMYAFDFVLTFACTGHSVVPRSWSICQHTRGEIQRLLCHYQQTTC